MKRRAVILLLAILAGTPVRAADLYVPGTAPLASDRTAHKVGDILTVLVYQSASATNSATSGSDGNTHLGGQITAGPVATPSFSEGANLSLGHGSDNAGTTGRSGAMVAEVGVVVDKVLPSGNLQVSGTVVLNLNGESTNIHVRGEVRPEDISPDNFVISSRLANADITYDGEGFVSRSARPGIVARVIGWLGL
jgi:flagellar L-ring protein precursor FlgH